MLSTHKLKSAANVVSYFSGNYYVNNELSDKEKEGSVTASDIKGSDSDGSASGVGAASGGVSSAGVWYGKGANKLGLSGAIDKSEFTRIMSGALPDGTQLGRIEDGKLIHTPGWDFTFSAPKSVSIMYELGACNSLINAHEAAVSAALNYLEDNSASARLTINGKTINIDTNNLVVGRFTHHESRELDPQLHTHSVIANMTMLRNGDYRSLDSRDLYQDKMMAGLIYRNELANTLSRMGYVIEQTHSDGRFEVAGVPNDVIKQFSKRRAEIEEKLKTSLVNDAKAAARVALITRRRKDQVSLNELRSTWENEAKEMAFDVSTVLVNDVQLDPKISLDSEENAKNSVEYAIKHLSERESVFTDKDLQREALQFRVGLSTLSEILQIINSKSGSGSLIPVSLDGMAAYTTKRSLFLEKANVTIVNDAKDTVEPIGNEVDIQKLLSHQGLKQDQYEAAVAILSTRDRVIGVQGFAGVGKTYMLEKVNSIAKNNANYKLIGLAPSSSAASQLAESSSIKSDTIAKFLASNKTLLDIKNANNLDLSKQLWVVDEASMLSNHDAYELLKLSELTNARVVLLGDEKQLAAIEAGKPFSYLQNQGMAVFTMDEIIRQKNAEVLNAVTLSIEGRIRESLAAIKDNVVEITDREERLNAIASQYLSLSPKQREKTLIATPLNKDRTFINSVIRDGLIKENYLGSAAINLDVYIKKNLTRAQKGDSRRYYAGDILQFNKAYRSLGVEKGEYFTVSAVNRNGTLSISSNSKSEPKLIRPEKLSTARRGGFEVFQVEKREIREGDTIRWTQNDRGNNVRNSELARVLSVNSHGFVVDYRGRKLSIDADDSLAKQWDHGYVSTLYSAQGKTSETVIYHADDYNKLMATQKSHYTGLSRVVYDLHVFVENAESYIKTVRKQLGDKTSSLESVNQISHNANRDYANVRQLVPDNIDYKNIAKQKTVKIKDKIIIKSHSR